MKEIKNIILEAIWSDKISKEEILKYIKIQDSVFKNNYSIEKFQKKFSDNIYGNSLIILAYIDNISVGAMVFWRNDIEDLCAYQPCEMAVLDEYRGYGIFTKMNDEGLNYLQEDTVLYNFPNDYSLPGYLKIGWSIKSRERYKLYNPLTNSKEIIKIDEKYLKWLLNDTNSKNLESLKYMRLSKKYYLLQKKANNIFIIIGEMQKESTSLISKAKFPILLHYSEKGYIGRGIVRVTRTPNNEIMIPLYKIGPLF